MGKNETMTPTPIDTPTEKVGLRPCPCCGSASVVYSENFKNIRCNNCWIRTEPGGYEKCKSAWNTRAPDAALAQTKAMLDEKRSNKTWRERLSYMSGTVGQLTVLQEMEDYIDRLEQENKAALDLAERHMNEKHEALTTIARQKEVIEKIKKLCENCPDDKRVAAYSILSILSNTRGE